MIKEAKIESVISDIITGIKNATDIASIPLSGGADSTLVAILCTIALGSENVYGYGMPYNQHDKDTFNSRSESIADKLKIKYDVCDIHSAVSAAVDGMNMSEEMSTLNLGNIKSRMRMIYIYSLNAQTAERTGKRCRCVGTGNMSEDFIGYDTKGGDALADFFPIGELYKSEVYQLLDYFVSTGEIDVELIDRTPSAGLEDGQTDEEDLGYSYNDMEPAIKFCRVNYDKLEKQTWLKANNYKIHSSDIVKISKIQKFVWKRHMANKHKHLAPPTIKISREKFE